MDVTFFAIEKSIAFLVLKRYNNNNSSKIRIN